MCLLTEAIKVQNKIIFNLDLHSSRMNTARKNLFNCSDQINLQDMLKIPLEINHGIYKCRLLYKEKIEKIDWIKYEPRQINSLKVVRCNDISYEYKFNDRTVFEKLLKKNHCSNHDAIIIIKNGMVTDSNISNVVLFNGEKWHTPKNPLLKGTKRAELLHKGLILEKNICEEELGNYEKLKLINAMMEFDSSPTFLIKELIDHTNI
jgi:4-amino-4-deoxychorismate lyase